MFGLFDIHFKIQIQMNIHHSEKDSWNLLNINAHWSYSILKAFRNFQTSTKWNVEIVAEKIP